MGFPGGSDGKESACNAEDPGLIPRLGNALKKGTATHSSALAWRIPWTEESDRLQCMSGEEWVTTEWLTLSLSWYRLIVLSDIELLDGAEYIQGTQEWLLQLKSKWLQFKNYSRGTGEEVCFSMGDIWIEQ